jgi:hypothetical protein
MIAAVRIGPDREPVAISDASLTRSLENAVSGLRFSTFEDRRADLGARIEAEFFDLPSFVGSVESWPGSPESGFSPTARSTTVNLQLTEALANERLQETTAGDIATNLCARVAVIRAPLAADEPVDRFRVKRGQSYQRAIQALCASKGYVLTDDADGLAVLYRAPRDRTPVEVWEQGHEPVESVTVEPSIKDWADVVVCRGQRSPRPEDVTDPDLATIAAEITVGNTRPSRRVLENNAARSKAAAARLVADEARKALASSLRVVVELSDTARQPGDIVRVRRSGFDQAMIVSEITWSVSVQDAMITATCVPIAAYDFSGALTTSGELVELAVSVDGDVEAPIPVLDVWGTHPELAVGQPVAILEHAGPQGEHAAIPMAWRKSSATRDSVALLSDVQSLQDAVVELQELFNKHKHSGVTAGGGISGFPVSNTSATVTIVGSDRHKVTHG